MRTTVTKLKAEVQNNNLPYLTESGSVEQYYVGRYIDALTKVGYTLTTSEKQAVDAFIKSGIDEGWIDGVKYFMPFIGSSSTPKATLVPLVDQVGDYEELSTPSTLQVQTDGSTILGAKISEVKLPLKPSHLGGAISATWVVNDWADNGDTTFIAAIKTSQTGARLQMSTLSNLMHKNSNQGQLVPKSFYPNNTAGNNIIATLTNKNNGSGASLTSRMAIKRGEVSIANAGQNNSWDFSTDILDDSDAWFYIGDGGSGYTYMKFLGFPTYDLVADKSKCLKYLIAVDKLLTDLGR